MHMKSVFDELGLVMKNTTSTNHSHREEPNKNQERMMPRMQRFELSTTDTLKLTSEPLLKVRLAILKHYQYHTFALRIPLSP